MPKRPASITSACSRRALLRGIGATAALLAGGLPRRAQAGQESYVPRPNPNHTTLTVADRELRLHGTAPAPAILADGVLPGPTIRAREGDTLRILVDNRLRDSATSIHWHGMLVPAGMDGVPDISNLPIPAQRTYVYEYPLRQAGTYWYHSHLGFQEQQGLYGALIIDPADEPPPAHEAIVILGDWLTRDPQAVFDELRGSTAPASGSMPGMEAKPMAGMGAATPAMDGMPGMADPAKAAAPGGKMADMRMRGGADLSDIRYDAFLLNGKTATAPWSFAAPAGEPIRVRLINGGASTYFRVALDRHALTVTHADGLAVQPVEVDHLLIGMGETYDLLVTLREPGSHTLHAVAQDGSGQAIGVLHTPGSAPQPNTAVPVLGPRALSYAALRALSPTTLPPGEQRVFRLPLQGDMARYVWMIDGQVYPKADPLLIRQGERVRLELINQTTMWHPMHLHGHFFRLLQGAGAYAPLKHTVNVAPSETVTIEFIADNPGRWFFHCHNAYHLEAGMARVFDYVA